MFDAAGYPDSQNLETGPWIVLVQLRLTVIPERTGTSGSRSIRVLFCFDQRGIYLQATSGMPHTNYCVLNGPDNAECSQPSNMGLLKEPPNRHDAQDNTTTKYGRLTPDLDLPVSTTP
jgi:hypothetical protein